MLMQFLRIERLIAFENVNTAFISGVLNSFLALSKLCEDVLL